MERDDEPRTARLRHGACRTGATSAATTPRCSGTPSRSPRSASSYERVQVPRADHAVRWRAEAARAGAAAARSGRGAAARRAGQLPRRARASGGWSSGCNETAKTVLFVSHDRELLARVADRIVTVEGGTTWVHGGGFASYHEARSAPSTSGWPNCAGAGRRSTQRLEGPGPHPAAAGQDQRGHGAEVPGDGPPAGTVRGRPARRRTARGAARHRCGCAAGAPACERSPARGLELTGLMQPFDTEIFYGERVGVLGANGAGKSHFLRLLAGEPVAHTGAWRLGARVVARAVRPDARPSGMARRARWSICSGVAADDRPGLDRGRAMGALRALRAAPAGRPGVRLAVRRAAGAVPDPVARVSGRDPAAARRADRQPRRAQRRGAGGGAGLLRRHRRRGHARPLVRPRAGPVPGLRCATASSSSRASRSSTTRSHCADAARHRSSRGPWHLLFQKSGLGGEWDVLSRKPQLRHTGVFYAHTHHGGGHCRPRRCPHAERHPGVRGTSREAGPVLPRAGRLARCRLPARSG